MDYERMGFKAGIEIHQQIEGKKLFCDCPAIVHDDNEADVFFERKLRAAAGETGKVDQAAKYEMNKDRIFQYEACSSSSCLVEYDDEPPHNVNNDSLMLALEVSKLLNAKIVDEVHFMRKTVVDGSNVSGFQRTALVGFDGYIITSKGKVGVESVCLEEEAAQKLEEKEHIVKFRLDRLGVGLLEIATDASIQDPEHAKEVSSKLGMILRSTGKVKRGIGSIRQDVNVSINGHPRVELKGFQDVRSMPKVIENEIRRQMEEKKGEAHVRRANPDGTSNYLRPMPGAARMYPETDVEAIRISKKMLDSIVEPELIDDKVIRFEKEFGLSPELARLVVKEEIDFKIYTNFKNVDNKFIAEVLVNYPKEIKKRYSLDSTKLNVKVFKEVLGYLDEGKVPKDAVMEILVEILQGKKVNLDKYKQVDVKILEKELKKIIADNKGAPMGALMGIAMQKFRGKVDGKLVMDLLKKLV
ncbi:MAG: Glu-tRNA(Gln) amidotransferase subunit GatE [Nanoarchaeota archaeon]|nr:Glu-tRNA(Gln) amidotransferase subunit GatE [Nanoarchaeota archaeon]